MRAMLLLLLFSIAACDNSTSNGTHIKSLKTRDFSVMCIGGVQYWVNDDTGVLVPKYNPISKQVRTCEEDGLMVFTWTQTSGGR